MMHYIRRFTKLAYQQYKQIFVTIHVEFLFKILCQIHQGDATIFDVFCEKKKRLKESPSFKTWRVFRMLLAFRNPGEHQLTDE